MASTELIKAVAVTAELCGRTFSPETATMFVEDLSGFDERQVLAALSRCRKEVRGLLTVQDVVSRLDDGRPGPDEAWAMLPKSEDDTVVWTSEMAEAWGVAAPLLEEGDKVGARLAFKETYSRKVQAARDLKKAPTWVASLGHDKGSRDGALLDAMSKGRLSLEGARHYSPMLLVEDKTKEVYDRLGVDPSTMCRFPNDKQDQV